jgi:hypothetical protein
MPDVVPVDDVDPRLGFHRGGVLGRVRGELRVVVGLAKGAWQVNAAGDGEYGLYINGTLSCYMPSGSPRFY